MYIYNYYFVHFSWHLPYVWILQLFVHHQSAIPNKSKLGFIRNERTRIEERCFTQMHQQSTKMYSMTFSVWTDIQRTAWTKQSDPRAIKETLDLPTQNGNTSWRFRKREHPSTCCPQIIHPQTSSLPQHHAPGTSAPFPTPNCAHEETPSTKSHVTTAINNTSVAPHIVNWRTG